MTSRIYLSPPHVSAAERDLLLNAFDSNWIAPLGPHVDAFEREFSEFVGVPHAVALSSGTAALHLALLVLGIGRGDRVLTSTLTFAATANAITYVGAIPVFVDVNPATWTINVDLLADALAEGKKSGQPYSALLTVDLYGQCADYDRVTALCDEYGVALIEDAAEAVGSYVNGKHAGNFGRCAAFSFNGNKIMTTSGGGMLVSHDEAITDRARHLSTQAREKAVHYEHADIGYNYRMSNLLAALGRGQLQGIRNKVARRRAINAEYRAAFDQTPGISFLLPAPGCEPNCWLTCITLDPAVIRVTREDVRLHLESHNIESRPVWKPMHLQPVFQHAAHIGGDVAARLFTQGLCLPSGSSLTPADQARVIAAMREVL